MKEAAVYEFVKEFDMVCLNQFIDKNKLEIFHTFYDKVPQKRMIFDLDIETFVKV
jgi:hypothetical protein